VWRLSEYDESPQQVTLRALEFASRGGRLRATCASRQKRELQDIAAWPAGDPSAMW